ncbi:MAG: DMT family transporter [bacterium]
MSWHILAIICSVGFAFQQLMIKFLGRRGISRTFIMWIFMAGAVPGLLVVHLWTAPHTYQTSFPWILAAALTGNFFAFYGYVWAIEESDVSLVGPMLSLSPLFMILTSWVMLDEWPDVQGIGGIVLVVAGTYMLARESGMSPLEPLYRIWEDKGTRIALGVSVIWSVTANIDKMAVRSASAISYAFWFHVCMGLLLLPLLFRGEIPDFRRRTSKQGNSISWFAVWLVGVALMEIILVSTQMLAIMETNVSYIIAVKRASMLITVLGGGLLFSEQRIAHRFGSALVVFVGLLAILIR